jgi:Zinc carboxypeptidase
VHRLGGILLAVALLALLATPAAARESLVRVQLASPASDVQRLEALGLDVTHERGRRFADVLLGGPRDRATLRTAGFAFTTRIADLGATRARARRADRLYAAAAGSSPLPSGRTEYRAYDDYLRELGELARANPDLVRPVALPRKSIEGRPIVGVEIADDVARTDDGRPVYVVMGTHHAREWPSAEVNMEFARDLVASFGRDTRVTALLRRERVFVIPIVNPDGFVVSRNDLTDDSYVGGSSQGASKRKNCAVGRPNEESAPCAGRSGVDLNRNYGAYWGGNGASTLPDADDYRGPSPWSEPETAAVHEFSQRLQITNFQTIHNIAALVLRPPGFRAQGPAPDEARLKELGDAMGAATGYSSEYGYQLYEVTGATEDWNYVAQGAFGYTIELGGEDGFQGPYKTNVVDQYTGTPGTPQAGKGVREALLLAGEQAADPRDHAIIAGAAPPGRVLRVRKDFSTVTSPVCPFDVGTVDSLTGQLSTALGAPYISSCPAGTAPRELPDFLDTTTVVPAGGKFSWHVNPSTRPFEAKAGRTESWKLTCETAQGIVLETQQVTVGRGQTATFENLRCGSTGATGAAPVPGLPPSPPAVVTDTPASTPGFGTGGGAKPLPKPPKGARLLMSKLGSTTSKRSAKTRRVLVKLRTLRVSGRDVVVTLRDFDRQPIAKAKVKTLGASRTTVTLRLPKGGLPKGRYRLGAQALAPNGAILGAERILEVR